MNTREKAFVSHEYDFVSSKITEGQVEQVIAQAGYKPKDYSYRRRVDKDGFVVSGTVPMNINHLEKAAKSLSLKVEITSPSGTAAVSAPLDTQYQVTVNMSETTANELTNSGYQLFAFKAVKSSMGGGVPVVWFASSNYSTQTLVTWSEAYTAYTTSASQISGGTITAEFSTDIDLGQTLNVNSTDGTGSVSPVGTAGAISIGNTSGTEFTCGIGQTVEGTNTPLCAFPLYDGLDVIMPIEKVLLMFSTSPINTGSVVEQSYTPSLLIDLTGAPGNSRTVHYDILKGWSFDGIDWATPIAPNEDLVPILVVNPS